MRGIPFAHAYDSPLAAGGACFKMGGGGTSSASSSATNQEDKRQAIGESGIILGEGSTFNFENPEGFAALLTAGAGVFEGALEFAAGESEKAGLAYDKALSAVSETKRSEEATFGLAVIKQAAPILLVVGVGAALIMASK